MMKVLRISTVFRKASTAGFANFLRQFGQWWVRELLALLPYHFSQWLIGHNQHTVVLLASNNNVAIQLRHGIGDPFDTTTFERHDFSMAALSHFLRRHELGIEDVIIGIRLHLDKFFERTFLLPVEAARSVNAITTQDLVKKTPFKLTDIYFDYRADTNSQKNNIFISQWIVRRDLINDIAHSLGLPLEIIAFLEADHKSEKTNRIPTITLRRIKNKQKWARTATIALSVSLALLTIISVSVKFWQQQSYLDKLDTQLALIKPKAQKIRAIINKLEYEHTLLIHLRTKKIDEPSLIEIWNETTRALPLHSWLTELRFSNNQSNQLRMTISGFSTSATSLVSIFDASPLFTDVALTAPIAIDSGQAQERFVMQFRIKTNSKH